MAASKWEQIVAQYPDPLAWLTANGRVFYASDADQDDKITGQTSFANTTPTLLLDVPLRTTAIPLMVRLFQTGTVAGGAVDVIIELDNAQRYSSGGTQETILCARTGVSDVPLPVMYSNPTATAGYGVRIFGATLGQDISPAEGALNEVIWTAAAGLDLLTGPAAMAVYTYAGTTGPTWFWTVKFATFPTDWLT